MKVSSWRDRPCQGTRCRGHSSLCLKKSFFFLNRRVLVITRERGAERGRGEHRQGHAQPFSRLSPSALGLARVPGVCAWRYLPGVQPFNRSAMGLAQLTFPPWRLIMETVDGWLPGLEVDVTRAEDLGSGDRAPAVEP